MSFTVTLIPGAVHTVIVYPESTEDVVKIVKIATKYRMPVIPYSGGTSLEGHTRGVSASEYSYSCTHGRTDLFNDDDDCVW